MPVSAMGMNLSKSLFSLDEDPSGIHSPYEESLWKQTVGFAWKRTKNHVIDIGRTAYELRYELGVALLGIGAAAASGSNRSVVVDNCTVPGEQTFHFVEQPLNFSQHDIDIMNGKKTKGAAALIVIASLATVGTAYECKGVYEDVRTAKQKREEFLEQKNKAIKDYRRAQEENEKRMIYSFFSH